MCLFSFPGYSRKIKKIPESMKNTKDIPENLKVH